VSKKPQSFLLSRWKEHSEDSGVKPLMQDRARPFLDGLFLWSYAEGLQHEQLGSLSGAGQHSSQGRIAYTLKPGKIAFSTGCHRQGSQHRKGEIMQQNALHLQWLLITFWYCQVLCFGTHQFLAIHMSHTPLSEPMGSSMICAIDVLMGQLMIVFVV
jgi:hypothetical protein